MIIVSVSIGRPHLVVAGGRQYSTAINRKIVDGPRLLTPDGFDGDRVSDLRVHGGPDKAACVFPHEHYAGLGEWLGGQLAIPSFGENLTTRGWLEETACIGDRCRIGQAIVQISQPRQPCAKLARKHRNMQLPVFINQRGWTGFYVRVLTPGPIKAGDAVELLDRPNPDCSVAWATHTLLSQPAEIEALAALTDMAELSEVWRGQARRRLQGEPVLGD